MPDWTQGMQQTFEYYTVDPATWRNVERITEVISSNVDRDDEDETKGSATFDATQEFDEGYVRVYLKTIQNGTPESFSLGTFLIQTPHDTFNGRVRGFSYDAYTPLLELKENSPPLGYFVPKGSNIMETAYRIVRDNVRAPVLMGESDDVLVEDFVASDNDSWLSFVSDLIAVAKFSLALDELSRVMFMPNSDMAASPPVWTYTDDNSSILYPDLERERDLYGIPNVVQVTYTTPEEVPVTVEVVNDDPSSPTSTVSRGRVILHRDTSPSINGKPSYQELKEYATTLLKTLSTLEYKISYRHGYCPVRIGDCVLLSYKRAGFLQTKAKVISQSISCEPGCPVDETAVYTIKLWEG